MKFQFVKQLQILPALILPLFGVSTAMGAEENRPNILFIAVDDLNDWVGVLGGHPQVLTPNIDRLANSGVLFTNAHAPAAACNPSRTSILTGRSPHRSGVYSNSQSMRAILPDAEIIPKTFSRHGYHASGSGKILHYFIHASSWHNYYPAASTENPFPRTYYPPNRPVNLPVGGSWQYVETDWAALNVSDEQYGGDYLVAEWVSARLQQKREEPFFLACGIYRPHEPWFVPAKYFEPFPLESIQLPPGYLEGDLDDLPPAGKSRGPNLYLDHIRSHGQWHQAIQSYLASIYYADAMIGKVLDALESGPNADNTIVVLWSDHGWHLGEKEHWQKYTAWRATTRVPFIIRVPQGTPGLPEGTTPSVSDKPVSLLSIFPTLLELSGLPEKESHDGPSLVPLLEDPAAQWPHVAVTYLADGASYGVSAEGWRLIRYGNGDEELYHIDEDPYEWHNLAQKSEHQAQLSALRALAPVELEPLRTTAHPGTPRIRYSFDDASVANGILLDQSGNGNDAQIVNLSGSLQIAVPGRNGEAFAFSGGSGQDAIVRIPSAVVPSGAAARTFTVWFQQTGSNGQNKIFGYGSNVAGRNFDVGLEDGGIRIRHWGGNITYGSELNFLADNDGWNHLAVRVNDNATTFANVDVFLNGNRLPVSAQANGGTAQAINTAAGDLGLGNTTGPGAISGGFVGLLDDFLLYGAALSDQDIAILAERPAAPVIVDLNPSRALYDSDVKGLVTDNGYGPASSAAYHPSGVPVIDDATGNAYRHELGFTFHVGFTPTVADLQGNRLFIELGAYANGTGLFLVDGVPTLIGKQNSADNQVPDSLNDTTLPTIAVQSSIGVVKAGVPYVFSASWDHRGNLELKVVEDRKPAKVDTFTITGTYGNWSGNDTLNVRTPHRSNIGGLSGTVDGADYGHPFDVDYVSAFAGDINRALFWNDYAFTPKASAVAINAFEITSLEAQGKVRVHWSVSPDEEGTLTVVRIKSGDVVLHESNNLRGYVDIPFGQAQDLSIEAADSAGSVFRAAPDPVVPVDSGYAAAVRQAAPVAWFRFNETPGSPLIVDASQSAIPYNGVLTGGSISQGKVGFVDGVATFGSGSFETARVFDPASFAVHKPHGGFSIETILNLSSEHNALTVLVSQKDESGTGRNIFGVLDNRRPFSFLGGGTYKTAGTLLTVNRWTHVVLVVDAGADEVRWYTDGQLSGRTTGSALGIESSQGGWVIGANKFLATPFKGLVDELVIYDYLLDDPDANGDTTDSLIAAHRNAWWQQSATASLSAAQIAAGQSVTLTLNLGNGIETVTVDGVDASIVVAEGKAVVVLTPTETTTYKIVLGGAAGTVVQEITVEVSDTPLPATAPRIHSGSIEGDSFVLRFTGQPDTEYRVTASSDLASFDQQIETVRTDADGNAEVSIPVLPEQTRRFFRVESID